jgi:hypothetical protein
MENKIVTKSLKKKLEYVILHQQMKNGTTIHINLSVNYEDQQFVTLKRVF